MRSISGTPFRRELPGCYKSPGRLYIFYCVVVIKDVYIAGSSQVSEQERLLSERRAKRIIYRSFVAIMPNVIIPRGRLEIFVFVSLSEKA